MGIPRLRRHLLPFCQTVLLQKATDPEHEDLECISSVVVDGPSLVYSVYSRLLSWFSLTGPCRIDTLPTCDEVSRGVMLYLMHLNMLGVEIESIYFDGALPPRKHETRVARLENQRRKLELFCAETKNGFETSKSPSYKRTIEPESILRSRPTPTKYSDIPANPFMVSAVFEDLKCRWDVANIISITGNILPLRSRDLETFPWAGLVTIVPGEADDYCAYAARLLSSCILTNDSDLLLYDLGNHGSVIFLDSVELSRWDASQPLVSQIKAAMLRPSMAAQRLGISSLLSLAYELKTQPEVALGELLQRSKNATAMAELSGYQRFAEEYQNSHCYVQTRTTKRPLEPLDTRISELFWQYELRGEYAIGDYPHVYLPTMNEDHAKRCAWVEGREYRNAAYSILNLSRPINERHRYVTEFVRRGQRIASDKLQLHDKKWISAQLKSLEACLESLQSSLGGKCDSLYFWTLFALWDSYGADSVFSPGDLQKLKQFLRLGYMGKQLGWADIHLTAQTHSVLYSLRILKQLLGHSNPRDIEMMRLRAILEGLPPLHVMMNTASERAYLCAADITVAQLSDTFGCLARKGQSQFSKFTIETARHELQASPFVAQPEQDSVSGLVPPPKNIINIYELLQEQ
ncbi:XPG domain containing-domain-containing protein [Aspergillus varians]